LDSQPAAPLNIAGVLVGRDRELRAIEGAVAAAKAGASTALVPVGDPAIGKSTLLAAREMAPALADGPPEPRVALAAE
jgi:hypothetical protein